MTDTIIGAWEPKQMTDQKMSPKIAAAVVAVMTDVPMLQKSATNTHANYNFAGIDDFLECLRPLAAGHGLFILQDEENYSSDAGWLTMRFRFTLVHASGDTYDAGCRTIIVNGKMGSQAFGAAQSYALKQFMRATFMVSTGEKGNDIDEHAATDLPKGRASAGGTVRAAAIPPQRPTEAPRGADIDKPAWTGPINKTALQGRARAAVDELGQCTYSAMLAGYWQDKDLQAALKQMQVDLPEFYTAVLEAKDLAKERCAEEDERRAIQGE